MIEEIQALETAITQFIATLVPLDQLDAVTLEDKHTLIAAHTLAHTASIQLYRPFTQDGPITFDKCSRAARACVAVIEHITEQDFGLVDPIIGVCPFIPFLLVLVIDFCKSHVGRVLLILLLLNSRRGKIHGLLWTLTCEIRSLLFFMP